MARETAERTLLLAIDTSSEQAGLALFDGDHVAEVTWNAGRDQTATVLGEIDRLCSLMHVAVSDLAVVAVATGPGMFNGLRVGMSVAKGLVLGLDVPLIGVSTLEVAAQPFAGFDRPVVPVVAAGRGRLVWAEYRKRMGALRQFVSPRNGTTEELASVAASLGACVVTGELDRQQAASLEGVPGVVLPSVAARLRRASSLAEIARERFLAGDVDDAVELEPLYVHASAR
jgi:tRNA threonylcarbamoyladenosine biosynthesis protein TsaB